MVIKLFGIAKEIVGNKTVMIDGSETIINVGDIKRWLSQQYPRLQELQSYAIAVDTEYADDATAIDRNSEIAVLPPVSGG